MVVDAWCPPLEKVTGEFFGQETLKLVVPGLLVVIGWFVLSHLQNRRERRKEIRELIDSISLSIKSLTQQSVEYFTENSLAKSRIIAGRMNFESLSISKKLLLLKAAGLEVDCAQEMTAFRHGVMGDYFETLNWKRKNKDKFWINDMMTTAGTLAQKLDEAYFSTFVIIMSYRKYVERKFDGLSHRQKSFLTSLRGRAKSKKA